MYWIRRPLMPPLSLTQSKYAFATLPMVVKSTPGISMSMPPSLIGAPVAFLPLPRPHLLVALAPVPTFIADEPPPAKTAMTTMAISATGTAANRALRCIIPPPPIRFQRTLKLLQTASRGNPDGMPPRGEYTPSSACMQDTVPDAGITGLLGSEHLRGGDDDVEEQRLGARRQRRDDLVELGEELVVRGDPAGRAAESSRDRRQLDLAEVGPRAVAAAVLLGEAVHDGVAAV